MIGPKLAERFVSLLSNSIRTIGSRRAQTTNAVTSKSKKRRAYWYGASAVFVGSGAYVAHLATPDWREIVDPQHYYDDWKIRTYFSLPLNSFSKLVGGVAQKEIPMWLRQPLYGWYARVYDCRMDEAEVPELSAYPTLGDFFNRPLRQDARPISATPLVSPADGRVLHYGKVVDGKVEYVKGKDYDLKMFLGDIELKRKPGTDLYQMVIYLAPGNYHAFHSPARWKAENVRHYPGLLLSVRPSLLARVPHLFCLNERVAINGHWVHGFFSMTAVAATNVGDVALVEDPSIRTNATRRCDPLTSVDKEHDHAYLPGEKVGEFRLGSTIVLIFEAPSSIKFAIRAGDQLRYGQSLVVDM